MFYTNEDDEGQDFRNSLCLEVPLMPVLIKEGETEPTAIFQRVQQTFYPPIFARNTWTKGVLHKDVEKFYKPSESIG